MDYFDSVTAVLRGGLSPYVTTALSFIFAALMMCGLSLMTNRWRTRQLAYPEATAQELEDKAAELPIVWDMLEES